MSLKDQYKGHGGQNDP